jgi:hypothetical protein
VATIKVVRDARVIPDALFRWAISEAVSNRRKSSESANGGGNWAFSESAFGSGTLCVSALYCMAHLKYESNIKHRQNFGIRQERAANGV